MWLTHLVRMTATIGLFVYVICAPNRFGLLVASFRDDTHGAVGALHAFQGHHPASGQASVAKPLETVTKRKAGKLQRLNKLPRKSVLPLMSEIKPQKIALSASKGVTTLSRTRAATQKIPLAPVNDDDVAAGRYCTKRDVSESNGDYTKIVLGNQSDKIYPGAIYGENAVLDGSYNAPANLQRRPYGIVTSLVSTASRGSSYVEVDPSPGAVYDGIVTLMKNNKDVVNASNVAVEVSQIYSLDQLAFELQAGYQGYGVDLAAEFAYSKDNDKRVILAKLTQVYFSVFLNNPDGSVLVSNVAGTLPSNITYVNKVNYGRLGILKIETSHSAEEIEAALDFRYSQGNQSANVASGLTYKKVLDDIKIDGFFFGGDATNGMVSINCSRETCAAKLDEFNEYARKGLRLDTMVAPTPISYELKYLNDSATAAVNSTTTYTERNCESARNIAVTLSGVSIQNIHQAIDGNDCRAETCNSDCGYAWGSIKVEIEERKNGTAVGTVLASVNGARASHTTIWQKPRRDPQHGMMNYKAIADKSAESINNVEKTFVYRLDPRVYAAGGYFLKVTSDIGTNHKDNHIAKLDFHGMKAPVVRDVPLKDALFDREKASTAHKYGSWIAGPFSSESNRLHFFRAHFTVKPQ